jgi:hypothetical protein
MNKLALFAAIALIVVSSSAQATSTYTDPNGVTWTIEGPAVGRWRAFPGAAEQCPSHHVDTERRPLYDGNFKPTRDERRIDKAAGAQTMHIICLPGPAATQPSGQQMPQASPPRQQSEAPLMMPQRDPNALMRAMDEQRL